MTVRRSPHSLARLRRMRLDDPGKHALLRCAPVTLDAAADGDGPKWQHVATEGTFKGYAGGEMPFSFTAAVFAEIVRNFRANPSFVMGPDGVGTNGIVQWDFHHASEAPPDQVAQLGAPAQGWVMDLRVQTGTGGSELWALTEWKEPAKSYIKDGKYKWASVAVALDAVDPVSGLNIGAILTSIAITNQPFIEGMTELAADKNGGNSAPGQAPPGARGRRVQAGYYYQANSIDDAKGEIRRCLGLPITATAAEIAKALVGLLGIVSGGEDAEEETGIDADEILGGFRTILGMPLLTPLTDVASQALTLFDTEIPQHGGETENSPGTGESIPAVTTTSKPAASAKKVDPPMTEQQLIALARTLGVQPTAEAVNAAVAGLVTIRDGLVTGLQLDRHISNERIAEAALEVPKIKASRKNLLDAIAVIASVPAQLIPKATRAFRLAKGDDKEPDGDEGGPGKADALIQKLGAMFRAGGVEDPDRAVSQIVKTLTDAAALEDQMPELSELRSYAKAAKQESEDEAVAATLRHYYDDDETHKDAVVALYKSVGRVKFLEKYPTPSPEAAGLDQDVAVEPGMQPTRVTTSRVRVSDVLRPTESPSGTGPRRLTTGQRTGALPDGVVNLDEYATENDSNNLSLRAIRATKATVQGADKWTHEQVCEYAFNARRTGKFVSLSAG